MYRHETYCGITILSWYCANCTLTRTVQAVREIFSRRNDAYRILVQPLLGAGQPLLKEILLTHSNQDLWNFATNFYGVAHETVVVVAWNERFFYFERFYDEAL